MRGVLGVVILASVLAATPTLAAPPQPNFSFGIHIGPDAPHLYRLTVTTAASRHVKSWANSAMLDFATSPTSMTLATTSCSTHGAVRGGTSSKSTVALGTS